MSEQASISTGELGGNVALDMWRDISRADIEERVRLSGFFDRTLGRIASDVGDYQQDQALIDLKLDFLLREFGVDPQQWDTVALKLVNHEKSNIVDKSREEIMRTRRGRSLGGFLGERAMYDLDIEGVEAGIGGASLTLMLSPSIMASLSAGGDFWTTREFINPHTSQVTDETNDRALLDELEKQGPVGIDSRADFQLEFRVRFSRPTN